MHLLQSVMLGKNSCYVACCSFYDKLLGFRGFLIVSRDIFTLDTGFESRIQEEVFNFVGADSQVINKLFLEKDSMPYWLV